MSLSDRERRLLAEMEEALASDDPRLQAKLEVGTEASPRLVVGISTILLGLIVIFGGLIAKLTVVGVLGFLVALYGVVALVRSVSAPSLPRAPKARRSFGQTLEDRWNKRDIE